MKDIFRTLLNNVHILLVSVVLVGMGLGLLQITPASRGNNSNNNRSSDSLKLSVVPAPSIPGTTSTSDNADDTPAADPEGTSDTPVASPQHSLDDLESDPSSTTNQTPVSPPEPSASPTSGLCGQCSHEYCLRYCRPSTPPVASPGPIGGCGMCGTESLGASSDHVGQVMCPMYCPAVQ